MEAKTSSWWSSATNWTISNGSLDSVIKFESSSYSQSTVDSNRDSPLILNPPTPDSFPCDIKLSFSQKHEIRQVYVRSTARIYELYYAPALETSEEYLCTVRCSTAVREEELMDATNEDDWVEVNFPDSPTLDNRNSSLTTKTCVNTRNIEDFYEATAEITNVEPCVSLSLRFLSIEGEGCVYVDEVYVFADPIESKDHPGNSAGSSLIAMLVPTLMQLSKPITCWSKNKHTSNQIEKREYFEITEPAKVQISLPVSNIKRKVDCGAQNNFPCSQLERLMEQLITKVSIIEDLCLRFEENMLKPINSIEARLQQVEQQLELLSKKSQDSGFHFRTTFSAPFEFSEDENCSGQDNHHPSFTASKSTSDESWNNEPSKYIHSPQVLVDVPFEEKSEGVDKRDQLYEGQCSSPSASIIFPSAQAKHDLRNKDYEITEETSEQEAKKGDTSIDIPRSSYDSVVDFYSTHELKFDSSPEHSPKSCVDLSTEAEEVDANACFVQKSEDGLLIGSKSGASGVEDGELMITLTKFHRMVVGRL